MSSVRCWPAARSRSVSAGPDSIGPDAPVEMGGAAPGLVLELRFPPGLAPDTAKQRSTVIARRMSRSPALQEVFDGVLAVRVAE